MNTLTFKAVPRTKHPLVQLLTALVGHSPDHYDTRKKFVRFKWFTSTIKLEVPKVKAILKAYGGWRHIDLDIEVVPWGSSHLRSNDSGKLWYIALRLPISSFDSFRSFTKEELQAKAERLQKFWKRQQQKFEPKEINSKSTDYKAQAEEYKKLAEYFKTHFRTLDGLNACCPICGTGGIQHKAGCWVGKVRNKKI